MYFHRQVIWLQTRFPDAVLADVKGLVKLVDRSEIEANDWSLRSGRYVGVAPPEVDDAFDFEETLKNIHLELAGLNDEAAELAATIQVNFGEFTRIREIERLRKAFGAGRWRKLKGTASVRFDDGTIHRVELHWYEAHGIGRRKLKIKEYLD